MIALQQKLCWVLYGFCKAGQLERRCGQLKNVDI
jgi:hypothetical protein